MGISILAAGLLEQAVTAGDINSPDGTPDVFAAYPCGFYKIRYFGILADLQY